MEKIDHIEQALDLLLSQFSDSPIIQELLKSWLLPLQQVEDDLIAFTEGNGISVATGEMLNTIGSWFGEERGGRSDSEYRSAILNKAIMSMQDGTTEKFIQAMKVLTNSDLVTFLEYYPRGVYAYAGRGWRNSLISDLHRVRPAGVMLRLIVDNDFNSAGFGEVLEREDNLVTGDGDPILVYHNGEMVNLVVSKATGETVSEYGDTFDELIDIGTDSPMADVVVKEYNVKNDLLVDRDGNYITDESGTPIAVVSYEE